MGILKGKFQTRTLEESKKRNFYSYLFWNLVPIAIGIEIWDF